MKHKGWNETVFVIGEIENGEVLCRYDGKSGDRKVLLEGKLPVEQLEEIED